MNLDKYIAKKRIVDLTSTTFNDALVELLGHAMPATRDDLDQKKLLKCLLDREKSMTTCLGNGIALPHVRVKMKKPYIFAVGRCPEGVEYGGLEEYKDLRIIFLLLASEREKSYLNVLASLAQIFQDESFVKSVVDAQSTEEMANIITLAMGGVTADSKLKESKFNKLLFKEAGKISKGAKCSHLAIFGDTFVGGFCFKDFMPKDTKTVLISQSAVNNANNDKIIEAIIPVRQYGKNRLSQLKTAILVGLTRGIFSHDDRLCCIAGIPRSNQFDTIVVVDIQKEFESLFTKQVDILPVSVKPEVMERVLGIASELSAEGREGKPVGSLFVLGDTTNVKRYIKPLVLNPFYGYKEEDRNLLSPFMDETVKEFSSIDGAFVIRGNGVIEAAGSLIHAPDFYQALPSGLGTRHSAAVAISMATDCIAIVVSSSTGQVTLFRRGQMLPLNNESAVSRGL